MKRYGNNSFVERDFGERVLAYSILYLINVCRLGQRTKEQNMFASGTSDSKIGSIRLFFKTIFKKKIKSNICLERKI
jgi:hypothetical protein